MPKGRAHSWVFIRSGLTVDTQNGMKISGERKPLVPQKMMMENDPVPRRVRPHHHFHIAWNHMSQVFQSCQEIREKSELNTIEGMSWASLEMEKTWK